MSVNIPIDESALDLIDEALNACIGDDGEIVGAEYTLPRLLDFWAGHEPNADTLIGHTADGTPIYENTSPSFHKDDLIRALVTEVRELRAEPTILGAVPVEGDITYVGLGGKLRSVAPSMELGQGGREAPEVGIRRAIWDMAYGYVSGFRLRDIAYYVLTRSLSLRIADRVIAWEQKRYGWSVGWVDDDPR